MKTDSQQLSDALQEHFGFASFLEGQEEAVRHVLAGRDTVVIMPTGSGKSLCFQLSSLLLDGITLVVSPLIALMKDQVDGLLEKKIPTTFINSTLSAGEMFNRLDGIQRGEYKLVYVAPERFRNQRFMDMMKSIKVSLLAIDEAHCISQWGHDFRPDYLRINLVVRELASARVMALTATATPHVREDIAAQLHLGQHGRREPVVMVHGFARPNLILKVTRASSHQVKLKRIRAVVEQYKTGIIYCSTRKQTERVSQAVKEMGLVCGIYHGGMSDEDRKKAQDRFMSGQLSVVAATNAFGMGVDRSDLRFVMHWDIPGSLEAYYQEIGRAGRDGGESLCELLYNFADVRTQEFFMEGSNPTRRQVAVVWNEVRKRCLDQPVKASAEEWSIWITDIKNDMAIRTIMGILERSGLIARYLEPGERIYTTQLQAGADLAQLEEQFVHMDKKRAADEGKLREMMNYANGSRCRHGFILSYFGEPDVASSCDRCDRCVRAPGEETRPPTDDEWVILQKILSCVVRMKARFGLARVVQVLLGSKAKAIVDWRLDQLSTHGILAGHKDAYLKAIMEALIQDGSLEISGEDYPLIGITPRGQQVLRREESIELVWPASANLSSARAKKDVDPDASPGLFDPELFNRLKAWRMETARRESLKPFMVFHDRTLKSIAVVCPDSHAAFERIVGIGPAKTQKYGDAILEIIDEWKK